MERSWIIRAIVVLTGALTLASFCEQERVWAPCEGVTCSGRGACELVDDRPACRCDEGYEPSGLACVPEGTVDAGNDADFDERD